MTRLRVKAGVACAVLVAPLMLMALLAVTPAGAALLSKSYRFKTDVALQVGEVTADNLRIDTVVFAFPAVVGGSNLRTGGLVRASVAISNNAEASQRIGIAVALFDDDGRLLGVASGGSRVAPLKPGRQRTFELIFDDVNAEAFRATTFQISVEGK